MLNAVIAGVLVGWLPILWVEPQSKQEDVTTPVSSVSAVFAAGVKKYVALQKRPENSVAVKSPTGQSGPTAEVRPRQQGELFTIEVAEQFRKIILQAFQEPVGVVMRQTILDRDGARPVAPKVNEAYPAGRPRTTMPPTLLSRLPVLPDGLTYRIVGHVLALEDTQSGIIVDFIPSAIP